MGQVNSCQRQAGWQNPFQNGSTSGLPPPLLSLFLALCLFNGNLLHSFFYMPHFGLGHCIEKNTKKVNKYYLYNCLTRKIVVNVLFVRVNWL